MPKSESADFLAAGHPSVVVYQASQGNAYGAGLENTNVIDAELANWNAQDGSYAALIGVPLMMIRMTMER